MSQNRFMETSPSSSADRIIANPSDYALRHYLYVQEAGTLTSLRPHISQRASLDSFLCLVVIKGCGTIRYNGNCTKLLPGDCVFIDCRNGYSHESSPDDPWTLKWVHFNGREAGEYYDLYTRNHYPFSFSTDHDSRIPELIDAIHATQSESQTHSELYSHRLLTDLVCTIIQICESRERPTPVGASGSDLRIKLVQLREYIRTHFAEELSLDSLADRSYISKYHLVREYRKEFGTTILSDITNCRLSHAKSLLRYSTDSVESIASQCGFATAGYFIKVFRRHEKMTPGQYRNIW